VRWQIAKAIVISHAKFYCNRLIDLQLYKIFKIMRVSFFGTQCITAYSVSLNGFICRDESASHNLTPLVTPRMAHGC